MNDPLTTLQAHAELLRGATLRNRSVDSLKAQLDQLLASRHDLTYVLNPKMIWFRARKCSTGAPFTDIRELLYREDGSPDYGRGNAPASRVLYASWNISTAVDEIGAEAGDWVQVVFIRPRTTQQFRCAIIGELKNYYSTGRTLTRSAALEAELKAIDRSDYYRYKAAVFCDAVLWDLFRQPVRRPYDYKATATFSESVYLSGRGLVFPSVEVNNSLNLAISADVFDLQFEVLHSVFFQIAANFGYGISHWQKMTEASAYPGQRDLVWNLPPKTRRKFSASDEDGTFEVTPAPGWQVVASTT